MSCPGSAGHVKRLFALSGVKYLSMCKSGTAAYLESHIFFLLQPIKCNISALAVGQPASQTVQFVLC